MLTIRLQRTGKKNQADFRIVLAEKEAPVNKKIIEVLGSYNPRKKYFQINEERVKYWLSENIEMSPTVHNLLVTKNLLAEKKVKAFSTPKKPSPAEATKDKPDDVPLATSGSAETPAEAKEATTDMEAKVA